MEREIMEERKLILPLYLLLYIPNCPNVIKKKKKLYLGDFNSSATSLKKKEILSARSQQKLPLVIKTPKLGYKSKTAMKEKEAVF